VKSIRDYGILDEGLEGDDGESGLVGGFEDDGTGCSGLLDLKPASGADAPTIAGLEAGESVLRHGGVEVVAELAGDAEEVFGDNAADGVDAEVVGASVTAAIAVEASHGFAAAGFERLAENIAGGSFDWFGGCHL
jgi:hypothetical protein